MALLTKNVLIKIGGDINPFLTENTTEAFIIFKIYFFWKNTQNVSKIDSAKLVCV